MNKFYKLENPKQGMSLFAAILSVGKYRKFFSHDK